MALNSTNALLTLVSIRTIEGIVLEGTQYTTSFERLQQILAHKQDFLHTVETCLHRDITLAK